MVRGVQSVHGGVALRCARLAVLPFDQRNFLHRSFLPSVPIAVPYCRVLVPMQQAIQRSSDGNYFYFFDVTFLVFNVDFKLCFNQLLSLEEAVQIDKSVEQQVQNSGNAHPQDGFTDTLFRQPSLVEGPLKPEAYRNHTFGSPSPPRSSYGGGGGDSSSGGLAGDNYYSKFATSLNRTPVGVQGMGEDEEKLQDGGPNVDKKNDQDTAELEQQIDKLLDSGGDFTSPRDSLSALGDELTLGMSALQQQFRNSNVSLFSRPSNKKGSMEERLID